MWKKKIALALGIAFFAGSLTFDATASAYIIQVGMEDLAAKEAAAEAAKSEKKPQMTDQGKDMKEKNKPTEKKEQPPTKMNDAKKTEAKMPKDKTSNESPKLLKEKSANATKEAMTEKSAKASPKQASEEMSSEPKLLQLDRHKKDAKMPMSEQKSPESVADGKKHFMTQKKVKDDRFQEIFRDNSFVYYMDTKSARCIPIPNRQEQMIDVWVKLLPQNFAAEDTNDMDKYYLEHYYINPQKKQIQFLCELEVTGRPSNAIKERTYSAQNWENLVPGSVEDDIYHAVTKKIKTSSGADALWNKPLASILDEYLNIAI